MNRFQRLCVAQAAALCLAQAAHAQAAETQPSTPAAQAALPAVSVQGHYENGVGTSDAASAGVVTSALIEARPTLRPGELLEFVPGVIVTQHSGDGKANQYFLRGFNLDHGTDFATWVDGMPANMPSHAHGQGYSDLNWLIPELVDRMAYRKGPYYADEGDFASAGSARIRLMDRLKAGIAELTAGGHGYGRALLADSRTLTTGNLLYAFETAHNDGPWQSPERFHRANAVLRYSVPEGATRWSLTAMAYTAGWDSTDQIPLRAVQSGALDRFGTVDPTDGGKTSRLSLSWNAQHTMADGGDWTASAYLVRSSLRLFSDFTYALARPATGDQFSQVERRTLAGGSLSRRWPTAWGGHEGSTSAGLQARQDRVEPLGLYDTMDRLTVDTVQESRVREGSIGLWAQNETQWQPWLRSIAGLRWDRYAFDVHSSIAANSGQRSAGIVSPKLSLVFGPWAKTEYFLNLGSGFHSNDARGVTAHVTPREGLPTDPVTPLVRSRGAELGARTEALLPGLQSSLSVWRLALGSELVFSGDAGDTQPSRASLRQGVEWSNHWRASPWLLLDADLSWSRARFTQPDPVGNFVPGAAEQVASLGATVTQWGPWFGQFQLRYFGPRPLIEDNSRRSASTTLAYLRVGYQLTPRTKLALDVFNLFDRRASDVDYFYASRLPGEPAAGVDDIHFHPVEPRSARLTFTANF
ncbi:MULTISPECIES: TonB-dependent receptor [Ramlibacter]|uniref:TonB-dependent receptor n=1 Tax=Ramlibacter sp. TaxID=1917967 RepID=UPI001D1200EF|nr:MULTISPECIES: TonB-dependent receptor [Ramlibacter]